VKFVKTPHSLTLDQRLVGTWATMTGNDETVITYSKDHRYSKKEGRRGFPTGFYNETGMWDISNRNRIELTPEHRKSGVAASDKKLTAETKTYEKAMDEGAWIPMPLRVSFIDDNTFSTTYGSHDKPNVYRRVR
jgi:hypothetical protein